MRFEEYLKNRDPQFTEGWLNGLNPEQDALYAQNRDEIDRIKRGNPGMKLAQAVARFQAELPAQQRMQNLAAHVPPERQIVPAKRSPFDFGNSSGKDVRRAGY